MTKKLPSPVIATYNLKGIFGIFNITADSFSDGGQYLEPRKAIAHIEKLLLDGADHIDIGAVSSSPGGIDIDSRTEIERIRPIFEKYSGQLDMLSIDTYNPDTQSFFIDLGIGWLNDIQGFQHPHILEKLTDSDCRLVIMHSVQSVGRADHTDYNPRLLMDKITRFFDEKLNQISKYSIDKNRLVIDPGMGFFLGVNPECSFTVIRELEKLKDFGVDIMLSVSKKSFIRNVSGLDTADVFPANLCTEILCCLQGANYIRTHEVTNLLSSKKILDYYFGKNLDTARRS